MPTLIDSPEIFLQLEKGGNLFCSATDTAHVIDEVCENFIIIKDDHGSQLLRSVSFADLVKDKWELR